MLKAPGSVETISIFNPLICNVLTTVCFLNPSTIINSDFFPVIGDTKNGSIEGNAKLSKSGGLYTKTYSNG